MLRGLYTSAHGMKVQSKLNDITANNLANSNTTGYKKDVGVVGSFPEMLLHSMEKTSKKDNPSHLPPLVGSLTTGVILHESVPSIHQEGIMQETGNPLDVAIMGEGFFVVNFEDDAGPEGERYTRQGNFRLNGEGLLVTLDGNPVQGQDGDIYITEGLVDIDQEGNIYADGDFVDRLRLVNIPPDTVVDKLGNTYFTVPEQDVVEEMEEFQVSQGFVEGSNVNPVQEMVNMIQVARAYEANQKAVQAHDQALEKSVNEVGRV